jgi:diguanylate cyclase (GGDEF)-like protein
VQQRAFRVYLAVALVAAGTYFFLDGDWLPVLWAVGVGYLGAAGVVLGIRRYRPEARRAWWMFAVAIALNSTGQLVEQSVKNVVCTSCTGVIGLNTFPSVADIFYLGLYPFMVGGLLVLIRHRTPGRDWAAILDSTTISVGLGLLSWVFLIRPAAGDPTMGWLGRGFNVAYPAGDVIMLSMVVRLIVGAGSRNKAFQLVAGSVLLFLGGDVSWAIINQTAWEPGDVVSKLLSINFLLAYVVIGAAAMHPSVRGIAEPPLPREPKVSATLLASLVMASLIAPGLLFLQAFRPNLANLLAIAAGSTILFVLVVTRIAQVLRRVEEQAIRLRELTLVDDLTGLPNRRAWTQALQTALEHARRDQTPMSVALLDLDHFKAYNDRFGHPAGDRLLRTAAAAWGSQIRIDDQLGRYGGEEFIVLFPQSTATAAGDVLSRLQAVTPDAQTFSAGLVTWDTHETSDDLIARADAALYEAKESGRNRVVHGETTVLLAH